MSSDAIALEFQGVAKKYSKDAIFHRSIREDIATLFSRNGNSDALAENEFWALHDISFRIREAETIGLYGPNGAGKSTILKLIARVTYPTHGSVRVTGTVAPLIEIGAGFHPDLTGRENIFMNGTILGMRISEIRHNINSIIAFSELEEFIDMPIKKYSSGMYLRLGFAIAMHSRADIYLIDEILAVGDESFQLKCLAKIDELKKAGKTLLVVSHSKELMEQVCDRMLHISKGMLVNESFHA